MNTSSQANAITFLEKLLFVYGTDTYCINKTIKQMSEDTSTPLRSVMRYLPILIKLGLLEKTYRNANSAKGYRWWVPMNRGL